MAIILNIETSTRVCSVALSIDGAVINSMESNDEKSHAKHLTLFIDEVLKKSETNFQQLNAISISKGPGSYTGLRIGVSAAKGLCYALDKPLIAVNTLQLMSCGMIRVVKSGKVNISGFDDSVLVPMIDARRMEVYTAFFYSDAKKMGEVKAEIINDKSFNEILQTRKLVCFGDGAQKAQDVIKNPNFIFIDNIYPSAIDMANLSEMAYNSNKFENAAYFEPFYLKDFVATIPKKNIFG